MTAPARTSRDHDHPYPHSGDAIAIGGRSLWTLDSAGVLTQRDAGSGQVLRRVPGLGRSTGTGEKVLAADATGVWVLRPRILVRVEGGNIVRRIPLPANTIPVLAADGNTLWVARTGGNRANPRLPRIDRATGALTGSLKLGSRQPSVLAPSPGGLWLVTADGAALLVALARVRPRPAGRISRAASARLGAR